jgi:uncharacterized protein
LAGAGSAAPGSANWQLVRVTVPEYLDRPQVLTRKGAAGLAALPGLRWAEPLAEAVPRALREDLAQRLGAQRVWTTPVPAGVSVQRQLRVELLGFEADEARQQVRLSARWTLIQPGGVQPSQGSTVIEVPVLTMAGADALAAAHRLAIARLAERITAP